MKRRRTAPGPNDAVERFRVTHPFHPLHGQELDLVVRRHVFERDCVYFHDDRGRLRTLPRRWTSLASTDVFESVASGRARFRPDDLLALVELIAAFRGSSGGSK